MYVANIESLEIKQMTFYSGEEIVYMPSWSNENIIYFGVAGGEPKVACIKADGTDLKIVTVGSDPTISPDGNL